MNKTDLIKAFVDETKVSDKVGSSIIETILDKMTETQFKAKV